MFVPSLTDDCSWSARTWCKNIKTGFSVIEVNNYNLITTYKPFSNISAVLFSLFFLLECRVPARVNP